MKSYLVKLGIIAVLLTAPAFAGAVGVAVNPADVSISAVIGKATSVRIKVTNPSSDVAVFEVYPDDFTTVIKAVPSSFTLESGAEKYVTLEVTAPQAGQLSTMLSVVARPLASNAFQAGSGVKVPLTIIAKEGGSGLASAFSVVGTSSWTGVVALGILAGWGFYRSRRKVTATPTV